MEFQNSLAYIWIGTNVGTVYIYERQQCGQITRRTEIEQSGRNNLPWTPNDAGHGRETRDATQNSPDTENLVQIGHVLENNSLFKEM